MTQLDWQINIENHSDSVVKKYGKDDVNFVFTKYGATGLDNLNPSHYDEVFGDLMLMDEDD